MLFSFGMFGWYGPYPVHINSVRGTIVNMTFKNIEDSKECEKYPKLVNSRTNFGNGTWEFNYKGGCTWLE